MRSTKPRFDRLKDHTFAELIPRRQRPYINLKLTVAEAFKPSAQLKLLMHMKDAPANAIQWTRIRQAMCLDRGFFLHRSWPYNFVNILSTRMVFSGRSGVRSMVLLCSKDDPFDARNGDKSLETLRRMQFEYESHDHAFYDMVFRFINQQDSYGFSNGWIEGTDLASSHLTWYRELRATTSGARSELIRRHAMERINPNRDIHRRIAAARARLATSNT